MLTLIQHFKSVKRLKLATEKEISDVIGSSKAKNCRILQYKLVFYAYSSCPFHAFCKPFY
jgi:ERCC4-type nuclease